MSGANFRKRERKGEEETAGTRKGGEEVGEMASRMLAVNAS